MINFVIFVLDGVAWYPGLTFEPSQVFKSDQQNQRQQTLCHICWIHPLHGPYMVPTFHQPEGLAPAPGASSSSWGSTFLLVRPAVSNADMLYVTLKKLHKTYYMLTYWILWIRKSILAPCTHVIPKILVIEVPFRAPPTAYSKPGNAELLCPAVLRFVPGTSHKMNEMLAFCDIASETRKHFANPNPTFFD